MKPQVSRRQFTKLAIGAAIVGFNPDARSWVTQASNTARAFDRLPTLDGALLLDEESRRAIATDQGNMFHRVPAASSGQAPFRTLWPWCVSPTSTN